jgi:tRNA(Ser,Leu) C12 N-acetylase TAN1
VKEQSRSEQIDSVYEALRRMRVKSHGNVYWEKVCDDFDHIVKAELNPEKEYVEEQITLPQECVDRIHLIADQCELTSEQVIRVLIALRVTEEKPEGKYDFSAKS